MMNEMISIPILLLASAWIGYCGLHSLLASLTVKHWIVQRWPSRSDLYRLAYNLLAVGLLIPLLIATELVSDDWLWRWQGMWAWVAQGITVLVILGFIWSSRAYDLKSFLGISSAHVTNAQHLGLSPLHRFVRHPWYFLGLVWLWTRDMDSARLVAALIISAYLWLGSRLEDRKLIVEFGPIYREYCRRVPGLWPRPWRRLNRAEFARLQNQAVPSKASMT